MSEQVGRTEKQGAPIVHPEFARRLNDAANSNPIIPAMNSGRLTYIADELKKRDVNVTVETVRKWFSGETRPQHKRLGTLAAILRVDEITLVTDNPEKYTTEKAVVAEPVMHGDTERLIAFLLELEGAHVAFRKSDDTAAQEKAIDLYVIANGKMSSVTIVEAVRDGDDFGFRVPYAARENTVLALRKLAPFSYELLRLDWRKVPDPVTPEMIYAETRLADLCWIKPASINSLV